MTRQEAQAKNLFESYNEDGAAAFFTIERGRHKVFTMDKCENCGDVCVGVNGLDVRCSSFALSKAGFDKKKTMPTNEIEVTPEGNYGCSHCIEKLVVVEGEQLEEKKQEESKKTIHEISQRDITEQIARLKKLQSREAVWSLMELLISEGYAKKQVAFFALKDLVDKLLLDLQKL